MALICAYDINDLIEDKNPHLNNLLKVDNETLEIVKKVANEVWPFDNFELLEEIIAEFRIRNFNIQAIKMNDVQRLEKSCMIVALFVQACNELIDGFPAEIPFLNVLAISAKSYLIFQPFERFSHNLASLLRGINGADTYTINDKQREQLIKGFQIVCSWFIQQEINKMDSVDFIAEGDNEELPVFISEEINLASMDDEQINQLLRDTKDDDYFDYTDYVHVITNRFCHHKAIKCPCMYQCRRKVEGVSSKNNGYEFDETSYRDMCAILSELPTNLYADPLEHYKDHFVVKIALTTSDKNIYSAGSRTKEEIMQMVYRIRGFYVESMPDVKKYKYEQFIAEELNDDMTNGFFERIKDFLSGTYNKFCDACSYLISAFKSMICGLCNFMSNKLSKLIELMFAKVAGFVISHFDVEEFIKTNALKVINVTKAKKMAILMAIIFITLAIDVLAIFTFKLAKRFVDSIVNYFSRDNSVMDISNENMPELVSEGLGPIAAIATLACTTIGLTTGETDVIKKKCDFFSSVLRAGTGISLIAGAAFVLLPSIFKDSLIMAFGKAEEKDQLICEDWIIKSTCIIRLSKIAKVLASEEMKQWIKDQINMVPDLIKKVHSANYKGIVLRLFSDLMRISSNLEQYHNGQQNVRNVPYSIHIAAAPGFGKSLLAPLLIEQAFGFKPSQIYTRNQTDEYWSGYIAQPVVFIDEFLLNKDSNVINRSADEYLKLISPSKFVPDFASVDNITTGLKGTPVQPEVVLTANNSVYMNVSNFPPDALDRRRRFVIECRMNPAKRNLWIGKNQIDVNKMTQEELSEVQWLLFDIRSPMSAAPIVKHMGLTYRELIQFLRDDRNLQLSDNAKLREALYNDIPFEEDPTAKLIAMMSEMKGAPRGTFDYDNPINSFFSMGASFFAEGARTTFSTKKSRKNKERKNDKGQNKTVNFIDPDDIPSCSTTPPPIYTSIEDVTSYKSCDDDNSSVSSSDDRDTYPIMYCSNVNKEKMHRHVCMACDRHIAVKRCDGELFTRCDECHSKGKPLNPFVLQQSILTEPLVFTDEEIDRMREQRVKDMIRLLSESRFDLIYDDNFPHSFWEDMANARFLSEITSDISNRLTVKAKILTGLIMIYIAVVGIRRLIDRKKVESEPKEICFVPESPRKDKITQPRRAYRMKAVNAFGESNKFNGLSYRLEINGTALPMQNGFPIMASKFITHRHSLLDPNGQLYLNGRITIYYKDGVDTVNYNCQMVRQLKLNDEICDLVMICLPPRMKINAFPNAVSKFWRDEDMIKYNMGDVCIHQVDGSMSTCRANMTTNKVYRHGNTTYRLNHVLSYCGVGNGPGWCGLLLESYGYICPGMYIGMHVAGSSAKGRNDGLYGLAMPITQEMLMRLIEYEDENSVPTEVEFVAENSPFGGPGLKSVQSLPAHERVMLSRVSKIKPNKISEVIDIEPKKHMPLLSSRDPRAEGEDPLVNMINDTLSVSLPEINHRLLTKAVASTFHNVRKGLNWVFPQRRLTFEEAVGGVPGLLTSINRNTSCGYPLCKITKGQGKKEYFWFDEEGKLCYSELYKNLVMKFVEEFDAGRCDKGRFVAYLKDELVTEKKILKKKCRIIYGGDLVANTAFRMIFGSFVIAYNHSYDKLSHVVGLNQYSYDMDSIYQYLTTVGDNFVAGDFSGWDKRMHPVIQKKVYYGIMKLCAGLIHPKNYDSFYEHQVKSPVIVEKYLLEFENTQFSGCFFTTILNCLVHDVMLRYIFDLACEQSKVNFEFDAHVRAKILGDDHIYCFSDEAKELMTPKKIQELYATIGAIYTNDLKGDDVGNEFRKFDEITFLGAHPRLVNGQWIGALKKDTINEMTLWTKNFNEDVVDRCKTAMEMSALWGSDYYIEKTSQINSALKCCNFPVEMIKPWELMFEEVANRTAASQQTYPRFIAEGNDGKNEGLVNLNADDRVYSDVLNKTTKIGMLRNKAIAEQEQDLAFGLESTLYRASLTWAPDDVVGVPISSIPLPFGLLSLGDSDNVQNMPFDRFLMWNGDVKIVFQVNGTPFMCGLLVAYFMPLASYRCETANITTTNHVFLQPDKNNTVELNIPYVYLRSVMNTVARDTESIGTVHIAPLSRLSNTAGTSVTVSVYSSFPNSKFSIPRPLPAPEARIARYYSPIGQVSTSDVTPAHTLFIAEGAGQSTNITNTYTNIGGTMPLSDITNTNEPALDFAADVKADMKIPVGLDNPPCASGAVPVEFAYPGFSTSYGVRPTRDMQLMPATFSRQQCVIFDPAETRIDVNCQRMCLLTTMCYIRSSRNTN
ncbi:hypothetical protein 1 [Hubei picorna-like virus 8]|uniref:hypothetical protein 1 n=1 Tax=Hubei picorna-like virus 8 TaxID=1923164 RepID=UPI00090ADFF5|nr:hypothetical protein 1 [Hubei picorna-like virus 8]APG77999.1 hypothetical protein 1 [Hubei picorna-like virus 8]